MLLRVATLRAPRSQVRRSCAARAAATAAAMAAPERRPVVTAFVTCAPAEGGQSRILLLRRSDAVSTYRGKWHGVSGGIEAGAAGLEVPIERALKEIEEETGFARASLRLVRKGRPQRVDDVHDGGARFLVHPFLFASDDCAPAVRLNWENDAWRWALPDEVASLDTVPALTETLARVLLPPAAAMSVLRLREDRAHGAAQLAGWALDALYAWATAPWGAGERGGASPRASVEGGPHWARERPAAARLRDVAYALATCRPAMATLRAAAAAVVCAATRAAATPGAPPLGECLQAAVREELRRRAAAAAAAEAHARALLRDGAAVLTLSMSSSVQRALCGADVPSLDAPPRRARLAVTVCESRPLREGVALAARCAEAGHAVQLCADAAAAVALRELRGSGAPQALVLLGADAITPSGGFVNKVGSRMLALAAADAGVPLFVLATTDKVAAAGDVLETEEMDASELDAAPPPGVRCRNVYFEETPARLVTGGIITEHGLEPAAALAARLAPAARDAFAEAFLED